MRFDSRTARNLSVGFALMLLPLATTESAVGAARPAAADGVVYQVQLSNRCLDADTNTINNNPARAQVWDCNRAANQRWVLHGSGELKVDFNGKCLDADTNTINNNGAVVQLWNCNGQPQQSWYRGANNSIRLKYNGKCLDHDTNQNRNGGKVQLWDCNGSPQQSWR
ncbi:ricin-type beta-trefoil lectin domain protein [Streptomyces sp. NPDC054904]|uniref:ricin-type beta-trefoil lectin domain protein n=1 Tax=unclassified Streptomyces TaxID=2593676 RepID=UPI0024820586|nr:MULTISPECIES: RICIN domain-containing protein [unclassified Streptomyces]MDA5286297.1 RICIN domain-containing protein [Streptomyces sp. Isolate_45]MDX2389133.1 ricin-type beta-trefoil lectin domain protein [Streptomyces sp. DK15]